jgi:hypothetical protein
MKSRAVDSAVKTYLCAFHRHCVKPVKNAPRNNSKENKNNWLCAAEHFLSNRQHIEFMLFKGALDSGDTITSLPQ